MSVLVVSGDGFNCERETAAAFERVGLKTRIEHIQDVLANPSMIDEASVMALPGGFSFGDEVRSGKILALKLGKIAGPKIQSLIDRGGLILGICNGFQVLIQLGLVPGRNESGEREYTLAHNQQGRFSNRWVKVHVKNDQSPWLKNIKEIEMPMRHGEGKIVTSRSDGAKALGDRVALVYEEDVNGSLDQIAGLTDSTGRVLGLMPHPEAALESWLHNSGDAESGALQMFKNAAAYLEEYYEN